MDKTTTVLVILDGYGITDETDNNAIKAAKTPVLDDLISSCPFALGEASGLAVGLPDGQMGNSEVGHLNIGAGRVVYQELTRITKAIEDGDFFENEAFLKAAENCKAHDSSLHLYGLVSDGGVHSHTTHLYALLEFAKRQGLSKVFVHAFLDGRDTPPTSAKGFLAELESKMNEIGVGQIATICGRYYAMDRDKRWERVKSAYDALVSGVGERVASASECIEKTYAADVNDEFVLPTIIEKNGVPVSLIAPNDSVIFFNFRPDRAREISRVFCDPDFAEFERPHGYFPLCYVTFTEIDPTIPNKFVAYQADELHNTLGEYLSSLGKTQLRLAETEKYAHVTFFFNGGREDAYIGEDRILVPSPKVATYDLQPEMSAREVTEKLTEAILSRKYDLIIINYANCDMVGHTGVIPATVKAVEVVDECVGVVVEAVKTSGAQMLICADHGNADKMVDYETREPHTAHTSNSVPLILVNCQEVRGLRSGGKLCDISPTLLDLMDIPKPKEMTGQSLLVK